MTRSGCRQASKLAARLTSILSFPRVKSHIFMPIAPSPRSIFRKISKFDECGRASRERASYTTVYDPPTIHVSAQPPFSRSDLYTCRLGRSRDGLHTHIYMALLYDSSSRQQKKFALNTQQRLVLQIRHQDTMAVSLPLVLIDVLSLTQLQV